MASRRDTRYFAAMSEADPISPLPPRQRKPDWIRVKAPVSAGYMETKRLMRSLNLATAAGIGTYEALRQISATLT